MTYTEKYTWGGKQVILKRQISPSDVVSGSLYRQSPIMCQ